MSTRNPLPRSPRVFISYSKDSDEHSERVLELSDRLRTDGVDAHLDQYEVSPTEGWQRWLRYQLEEADYVLLVCTESYARAYLGSEDSSSELETAWTSAILTHKLYKAAVHNNNLIPILFSDSDAAHIPSEFQGATWYSLSHPKGYETLYRRLTDQPEVTKPTLGKLRPLPDREPSDGTLFGHGTNQSVSESTAAPHHRTRLWNVPDRTPFFVGRGEDLERLREDLRNTGTVVLRGLGGVGKTQAAIEYVKRYRDDYHTVFWARAESEAKLIAAFEDIANVLDLPGRDARNPKATVRLVREWLEQSPSWLLVLDNADKPEIIRPYFPTDPPGHLLLTSRARVFDILGIKTVRRLDTWSRREAIRFLFERTRRENASKRDQEAATELAEDLGHLPLALEQASAYIVSKQVTFAEYLESFRARRLKLLDPLKIDESDKGSVVTTWDINFRQAKERSKESADVLRLSAFFAPDRIPLEILVDGARELGPILAPALADVTKDPVRPAEILEPLTEFSLIEYYSEDRSFSIHQLVQEVMKARMSDKGRHIWTERCVRALHRVFPRVDIKNWSLCERLETHVIALSREGLKPTAELKEAGVLFDRTATYCHERGRYREATPLYDKAFRIHERVFGKNSLEVAASIDNLATLLHAEGAYTKAEPFYERALNIREIALGPNHSDVASSADKLAMLRHDQGRYDEAEPLYERALEIRKSAFGLEHSAVARSFHNLANLHRNLGRYDQAKQLHEQALKIREKVLGSEHPDVATSLDNLATLHRVRGYHEEAAPLHERALRIREQKLGPEHPRVATSLNNLANLRRAEGALTLAVSLLERAVQILETALGSEHPDLVASLTSLARIYREQGEYGQAVSIYRRVLRIREETLRPDDPRIARSLNKLANIYSYQREYTQATPLYERALQIREATFGPEHIDVAQILYNLAVLHDNQRAYDQALPLYERALRIRERTLGAEHLDVGRCLNNMANLHSDRGDIDQAIPFYDRALRIHQRVLGPTHPDIALVARNYALLLRKIGQDDRATELEDLVTAIRGGK